MNGDETMKIVIPFKAKYRDLMISGQKTCTSRRIIYGKIGDTFEFADHIFVLKRIEDITLSVVALELYKHEGCKCPEEFINIWMDLYPRDGWTPNKKVWVHFFTHICDTEPTDDKEKYIILNCFNKLWGSV